MSTFGEALASARTSLQAAGVTEAARDARLLLAAAAELDASAIIAREHDAVPAIARQAFDDHMRRRLTGEPVARILGEKEFWSLPIKVGAATLVPRPETETLVDIVLAAARRRFPPERVPELSIADLGTGSGVIALALLSELPQARVVATDICADALAIARLNADRLGLGARIDFERVDFLSGPAGPFHVTVANPPYIRSNAIAGLAREVRDHDPRTALDGGPDGLAAYRAILARVHSLLRPGGLIAFEVGYDQGRAVAALCRAARLGDVCVHADLAGHGRVVTALRIVQGAASEP